MIWQLIKERIALDIEILTAVWPWLLGTTAIAAVICVAAHQWRARKW